MTEYKKYFCTFADSKMKKALERVEKQVMDLVFSRILNLKYENN